MFSIYSKATGDNGEYIDTLESGQYAILDITTHEYTTNRGLATEKKNKCNVLALAKFNEDGTLQTIVKAYRSPFEGSRRILVVNENDGITTAMRHSGNFITKVAELLTNTQLVGKNAPTANLEARWVEHVYFALRGKRFDVKTDYVTIRNRKGGKANGVIYTMNFAENTVDVWNDNNLKAQCLNTMQNFLIAPALFNLDNANDIEYQIEFKK